MEQLKKCTICKKDKFINDFYKNTHYKFGVQSRCKTCINAKNKDYRQANSDKIKADKKAYYKANFDKIKADKKAYNKANSEKFKAYQKAYKQANPEKFNASASKRRALKLTQTHLDCDNKQVERFYRVCSLLSKHTGTKYHVDHILPISKGGPHHHDNLQIITQTLNNQKSNNTNFEHQDLKHWTDLPIELLNWIKTNNLKQFSKVVKIYGIDKFKNKLLNSQQVA